MRLFVAVNFDESVKKELSLLAQRCTSELSNGTPVRLEHFHITLAFLGETQPARLPLLRQTIASVGNFEPFTLRIEGLGRFTRSDGDILWADVKGDVIPLSAIRQRLCNCLSQAGFQFDERDFHPHMTLVRRAVYKTGFAAVRTALSYHALDQRVERLSLMKSERINGLLTYTEL